MLYRIVAGRYKGHQCEILDGRNRQYRVQLKSHPSVKFWIEMQHLVKLNSDADVFSSLVVGQMVYTDLDDHKVMAQVVFIASDYVKITITEGPKKGIVVIRRSMERIDIDVSLETHVYELKFDGRVIGRFDSKDKLKDAILLRPVEDISKMTIVDYVTRKEPPRPVKITINVEF